MTQPIPFGKYYLLERINVGGMAEVFKAKAVGVEGFERTVAVKRILPSIAEDQEFITMFIDEAKIAVQLTHANIAQIFDLGRVDDSYFIALEYVHGKDLRAIFNRARTRGQPLPYALACYAIMRVCEGLEYAHNKRDAAGQFLNLVHRDVSPQNVLVSYEGEVKIIDFGIAKAAGKAGNTQTGILKGKFGYMSPEQANASEIDRRSDLFAVGICLYELLTGERAFLGETDLATLDNVRTVKLTPPREHNAAIPEALEAIVLKALRSDREQRYQTAQELRNDLAAFLRSEGKGSGDRRELSAYMHREFAEELASESTRNLEHEQDDQDEQDEVSGLSVFDHVAPQEVAFELGDGVHRVGRAQHKTTLHGLPALHEDDGAFDGEAPASAGVRPLSVPPLPQGGRASAPPPNRAPELEWDDEELSTQIYDPPEERAAELGERAASPRASWASELPSATRTLSGRPPPYQPEPAEAPGTPSWRTRPERASAPRTVLASRAPSAPRPALVAGTAALLVLGFLAFLLFFRAPASGSIELETSPQDVALTLDGRPVGSASPFRIQGVSVGNPHTLTIQKAGYRPWSARIELRHGETLRLQPVSLEPIESGFALDSVPSGASVFVDGVRLEQTTPVRVDSLRVGEHRIRVEAHGYSPWESSVKVTAGTMLDLPVAQLIARTAEPAPRRPGLAAGAVAERDDSAPAPVARSGSENVGSRRPPAPRKRSEAEQAAPQQAAASDGVGTLRIQTKPWSTVSVDGAPAGTTPLMNIPVKAGKRTLTFVNEEFGIRKTVVVQVEPGKVSTHVLDLTR